MIDLARIGGGNCDDGNARKNDKHGVGQAQAEEIFFNQPLLMLDERWMPSRRRPTRATCPTSR